MNEISIIVLIIYVQILVVLSQYPQPRIYGGFNAQENQFPYQVSLQKREQHVCGGAILTKSFVVTSSVCVTNKGRTLYSPIDYVVIAGITNMEKEGLHFTPQKFIVHERNNSCKHVIALIQLKKPFRWNKSIKPIPIYEGELHQNEVVIISGWGAIDKTLLLSDELKYHYSVVTSAEDCKKFNPGMYYEGLLCLSHAIHKGACLGDIGGPAIFQDKLVGISSFILTACGSEKPDVYLKVSHFLPWINNQIY